MYPRVLPVVALLLAGLTALAQKPSAQGWSPDRAATWQQLTKLLMQGRKMTPADAAAAERILASSPDNLIAIHYSEVLLRSPPWHPECQAHGIAHLPETCRQRFWAGRLSGAGEGIDGGPANPDIKLSPSDGCAGT